jgi:hypothetical protein
MLVTTKRTSRPSGVASMRATARRALSQDFALCRTSAKPRTQADCVNARSTRISSALSSTARDSGFDPGRPNT